MSQCSRRTCPCTLGGPCDTEGNNPEFPFICVENVSPHPSDPCHEVWFDPDLEHAQETAGHLAHQREIYLKWKAIEVALELLAISEEEFLSAVKHAGELASARQDAERYALGT